MSYLHARCKWLGFFGILWALLVLGGCDGDDGAAPGDDVRDATVQPDAQAERDAGSDAPALDARVQDAEPDAEQVPLDAAEPDAAEPDAGAPDADALDASEPDAAEPDAAVEIPVCGHANFVNWVAPAPDTTWGTGQSDGQLNVPDIVCGPPLEPPHGNVHTVSLGNGGSIVVRFDQRMIVDGPGVDFIVFENPFAPIFPELGTVSVSANGSTWFEYPCTAPNPVQGGDYGTCAGWRVVGGKRGDPIETWTNPLTAGGDQFDLADLALPPEIKGVRYVRIVDRVDDASRVFDLDAVGIVHGQPL